MIVKLDFLRGICTVTKENGDVYYSRGYSSPESRLLYHVKQKVLAMGYDVIKTRMWKDGHLVEEERQYIRSRKPTGSPFCIFNNYYDIYDAGEKFNQDGMVELALWEM